MHTTNIFNQVPSFISSSPFVYELLKAEGYSTDKLHEMKADVQRQLFVDTATWGLPFWEKALGLPSPDKVGGDIVIEQNDPILEYVGEWREESLSAIDENFEMNKGESDGIIKVCNKAKGDKYLEFDFYGTGFELIRSGIYDEYYDTKIMIDEEMLYAENEAPGIYLDPVYNHAFFKKEGLHWGYHTVRITPLATTYNEDAHSDRWILDRIVIHNNLAQQYESRRAKIKAKLVPVRNVTNEIIREIAKSYGFNDIIIDETEPLHYSIEFENNTNTDPGMRVAMLRHIEELIPAHIGLKNRFFIATFKDINDHLLTWDALKQGYVFYDFLIKPVGDFTERFNHLYKFLPLSVFDYRHFNDDLHEIERIVSKNGTLDDHSSKGIKLNHLKINIPGGVDGFSSRNRKLLSQSQRNTITIMSNRTTAGSRSLTEIINVFVEKREKLRSAINNHPFLESKGTYVSSNNIDIMLKETEKFKMGLPVVGEANKVTEPDEIAYGKTVFNGSVYITGSVRSILAQAFFENNLENGKADMHLTVSNPTMIEDEYNIPPMPDLLPRNIMKGVSIFGTVGTIEAPPAKYYKGDFIFDWNLEYVSSREFKIIG